MPFDQTSNPGLFFPDKKDANVAAQNSNPNTPVTPTPPKGATEPTQAMTTVDPSNGGVVPEKRPVTPDQIDTLNKGMRADMQTQQGTIGDKTLASYGVYNRVQSEENIKAFNNADLYAAGTDGKIYQKKVESYLKDSQNKGEYNALQNDLQKITDFENKKPNSGIGLHIDLGPKANDTLAIATDLMQNAGKDGSPLRYNPKYPDLAKEADIKKFNTAYQEVTKYLNSDPNSPELQNAIAELKMATTPMVDAANGILNATHGDPAKIEQYTQYLKDMDKFSGYYYQGADGLKDMVKTAGDAMRVQTYSYQDLEKMPSRMAKQQLNSSPEYKSFLQDVFQNNPEMQVKIDQWSRDDVISADEEKFINESFFGKNGVAQLEQAYNDYKKNYGTSKANEVFGSNVKALMDIKYLGSKTAKDDYYANLKTSGGFNKMNVNFQMNAGGMISPPPGQTTTGSFSPGHATYSGGITFY